MYLGSDGNDAIAITVNNSITQGQDMFYTIPAYGIGAMNSGMLNASPPSGSNNTNSDPLFVDATNGDYRLSNYSPAIGAGTSTGAPSTDINGTARPSPSGSNPDMGAYENARPSQRPKAGAIADGSSNDLGQTDNDWSNSVSSLSAHWANFTDNGNIATLVTEFAIGSSTSNLADVLNWTTVTVDTGGPIFTATGLTLTEGSTYYVSVRATDSDGQVSDTTTTDGTIVDLSLIHI